MTVKELKDKLAEFPNEFEVLTKKTDIGGNCGLVGCVIGENKCSKDLKE